MSCAERVSREAGQRALLACLAGALALATAMAAVSVPDAHPDERFHLAAGAYYRDHWLPPPADEAVLLPSLSSYGLSYLGDLDVSYFLAGKVARALEAIVPQEHLRFRAFNLFLFFALIALYASQRRALSPLVLLLVTPQIWYVFSYFNNDALPLCLSLALVVGLFGAPAPEDASFGAPWHRLQARRLLGCGVLLGLLALTKPNYLPFLAFVGLLTLWRTAGLVPAAAAVGAAGLYLAQRRGFLPLHEGGVTLALLAASACATVAAAWRGLGSATVRAALLRFCAAAVVAVCVAAPPILYDRAQNGPPGEKSAALVAIAARHAAPEYRTASVAMGDVWGIGLRAQGVTLPEILLPPRSWAVRTWKSFTGYYGYMRITSPFAYYLGIAVVYTMLAMWTMRALLRGGRGGDATLLAAALAFAGATAAVSLYHSWVNDFQPQGRYLFPAVAIAAVPFQRAASRFSARDARAVRAMLVAAFAFGTFSFAYRGLRRIPKLLQA
jgi:hypothetical protein